jgi:hypothetical protein
MKDIRLLKKKKGKMKIINIFTKKICNHRFICPSFIVFKIYTYLKAKDLYYVINNYMLLKLIHN